MTSGSNAVRLTRTNEADDCWTEAPRELFPQGLFRASDYSLAYSAFALTNVGGHPYPGRRKEFNYGAQSKRGRKHREEGGRNVSSVRHGR